MERAEWGEDRMKRKGPFRRALALALAVVMLLGAVSCGRGEEEDKDDRDSARATSMHLRRTEGTVTVENDEGDDLEAQEDMGLYDGYQVGTQRDSYAWIDLDKSKLTKLDERSEVEIQRKGDELELTVRKGGLFFNITKPLDEDETFNIRTSTMVVGIRGTCGWVRMESKKELNVYILEGTVECSVTAKDGKIVSASVTAGEKACITREEDSADIQVEDITPEELPEFVLDELEEDEDLCQAIQSASGLDLGAGGEPAFRVEDLANTAYVGDLSRCAMTEKQAQAFAQVLEECMEEMGHANNAMGGEPFLRTALFDAGDGIPVLWVVMGSHVYDDEYGYIPSSNRFYQWDGRKVIQVLQEEHANYWLNSFGLVLDDYMPELDYSYYSNAQLHTLSHGEIAERPSSVVEEFGLFQAEQPTADEVRAHVDQYSVYHQSYDFRLAIDRIQKLEWDDIWRVSAVDGTFMAPYSPLDWRDETPVLGHGQNGHQDVDWDWCGEWSSAEDMLAALTGDSPAQPEDGPQRWRTVSTYDPQTHIRRTTLNTGLKNLEIYYEIPVFPDPSGVYRDINRFFQEMEDEFFSEGGEAASMIAYRQETDLDETFATTYDAEVHTDGDGLVSVSLYNYYHGGGPHPNTYQESYTFRTDTGELVKLTDLINGTPDEIRTLIADALEPDYALESSERASILAYDIDSIHFWVEDESVWVYFNAYEISYYARGSFQCRLDVPLKELS